MLLQLPPSVTRLYHSMSSTSPSRHHIFTPSPPSYSLSSPLSDCRLAVVTSFRIFLAFRVQLAITSSVCLALPLASFPLHRLRHFLAMLRLRPLSARLAVIRHLQHIRPFSFYSGFRALAEGVCWDRSRDIHQAPRQTHLLLLLSSYRRFYIFCFFHLSRTFRGRSPFFLFLYKALLYRLVPQPFLFTLRYSLFSFSFCS